MKITTVAQKQILGRILSEWYYLGTQEKEFFMLGIEPGSIRLTLSEMVDAGLIVQKWLSAAGGIPLFYSLAGDVEITLEQRDLVA